jgi:hypothetical protein
MQNRVQIDMEVRHTYVYVSHKILGPQIKTPNFRNFFSTLVRRFLIGKVKNSQIFECSFTRICRIGPKLIWKLDILMYMLTIKY